jgi:hypothetical protein
LGFQALGFGWPSSPKTALTDRPSVRKCTNFFVLVSNYSMSKNVFIINIGTSLSPNIKSCAAVLSMNIFNIVKELFTGNKVNSCISLFSAMIFGVFISTHCYFSAIYFELLL